MRWDHPIAIEHEKGMINHYFALCDIGGKPIVTLPNPRFGVNVSKDGTISGERGAGAMWNGAPPSWCCKIVEVRSPVGWYKAKDSEKTVIWEKTK